MLTFEEALAAAREHKPDINYCKEFPAYYEFSNIDITDDIPIYVDIDSGDIDDTPPGYYDGIVEPVGRYPIGSAESIGYAEPSDYFPPEVRKLFD